MGARHDFSPLTLGWQSRRWDPGALTQPSLPTWSRDRTPSVLARLSGPLQRTPTSVQQHVPDEHPLVRGGEGTLGAFVDLLVGVHLAHVVMKLHGVESGVGAEAALELLAARVPLLLVLAENVLVGADEVALLAVEGVVGFSVSLHGLGRAEEQRAGMVLALHGLDAMSIFEVTDKLLPVLRTVVAAPLEAAQPFRLSFVSLQVLFEGMAEPKLLLADRAGVNVGVEVGDVLVHAGHVAVEGILLHRAVVAERAAMGLLTRLPHHVDFQLAFAGEVLVAVGALQAGVGEVQVEVLHQVRPLLEAPLAFRAHVGFVEVLRALRNIPCESRGEGAVSREETDSTGRCSLPDPAVPG